MVVTKISINKILIKCYLLFHRNFELSGKSPWMSCSLTPLDKNWFYTLYPKYTVNSQAIQNSVTNCLYKCNHLHSCWTMLRSHLHRVGHWSNVLFAMIVSPVQMRINSMKSEMLTAELKLIWICCFYCCVY